MAAAARRAGLGPLVVFTMPSRHRCCDVLFGARLSFLFKPSHPRVVGGTPAQAYGAERHVLTPHSPSTLEGPRWSAASRSPEGVIVSNRSAAAPSRATDALLSPKKAQHLEDGPQSSSEFHAPPPVSARISRSLASMRAAFWAPRASAAAAARSPPSEAARSRAASRASTRCGARRTSSSAATSGSGAVSVVLCRRLLLLLLLLRGAALWTTSSPPSSPKGRHERHHRARPSALRSSLRFVTAQRARHTWAMTNSSSE
mmetsp:Transcript_9850/g.40021  ORF Transcript_9850/g.40021 Transcript_9850/m.40021 type:complete len:258 (-) Transcript_9850:67-840(-)